jgi:hypothetical protein
MLTVRASPRTIWRTAISRTPSARAMRAEPWPITCRARSRSRVPPASTQPRGMLVLVTASTAAAVMLIGALGVELGAVRVHTDPQADRLARSVGAVAFTSGQDIFFRQGAYDPVSRRGLHLLAHEVTHTAQDTSGLADHPTVSGGITVSSPADGLEQAANQVADYVVDHVTESRPARPGGGPQAPTAPAAPRGHGLSTQAILALHSSVGNRVVNAPRIASRSPTPKGCASASASLSGLV